MGNLRIAINGLGRIGRLAFRLITERPDMDIVGVNDLAANDQLAYLLKYDTAQRTWSRELSGDEHHIYIDGHAVPCHANPNPDELDWEALDVDIVLECSGYFTSLEGASRHLSAGAKRVLISAPGTEGVPTYVMGINERNIRSDEHVISNASCTTNCLAMMVKVLDELCGIDNAMMGTVHSYTGSQRIQDAIHQTDWRRGRAAAMNVVPTTTSAVKTLIKVMPELEGKLQGGALRVPVITGSITELYANVERAASVAEINAAFQERAGNSLRGILEYTEDPIVSWDVVHNPHSCIFDARLTQVHNKHVKIVGWYDNEFGYANRLIEMAKTYSKTIS